MTSQPGSNNDMETTTNPDDYKDQIRSVAEQIQKLLVDNGMVMTPSIQIGLKDSSSDILAGPGDEIPLPQTKSGIIVPSEAPAILTQDDNLMNKADFMQP